MPRRRTEARADRGQARSARARPERHAGLLARGPTDAKGVRRGRLLPHRRRAALRRCPTTPRRGFLFDGRIAEDFKLATGTWVSVGPLRAALRRRFRAARQGRGRSPATTATTSACLIFPDLDALPARPGWRAERPSPSSRQVREAFRKRLAAFAARATGSSSRVARMAAARRAALDRRGRDHRQGFAQPARGVAAPRRSGRGALRSRF